MKGIKLVPAGDKNMELAFELFRFEIYFMRRIVTRRKIIVEGQDEVIKMIVPE